MEKYNLKGTYEPGSLEEVVGEAQNKKLSQNIPEIIMKNGKNALGVGAISSVIGFGLTYAGFSKSPTDIFDMVPIAMGAAITAGGIFLMDYLRAKKELSCLEHVTGRFIGFMVGYGAGSLLGEILK